MARHIKDTFKVRFNLKKVPYGKGWCLDTGKISDVYHMIEMIKPFGLEIASMKVKVSLMHLLAAKEARLYRELGDYIIVKWPALA